MYSPEFFLKYFLEYKYFFIPIIIFFFTIVPIPFPEELLLLILGYICFKTQNSIGAFILITYITVQLSDVLLYYFGYFFRILVMKGFKRNKVLLNKIKKGRYYCDKYGTVAIFFARFIFGLRSSIFMASGFMKYGLPKFIIVDGLAGLINVPIVILLGYYFPDELESIWAEIKQFKFYILILFIVIIIYKINMLKKRTSFTS